MNDPERLDVNRDRARGCLLGQLIGDSLGSLVEFQSPEQIQRRYPTGVCDLEDGGTWGTIAGQPTDDSEMALALARTLVDQAEYDQNKARSAYVDWLNSRPFDVGNTVSAGLRGTPNFESQANGALMRVSPLGIFGAGKDSDLLARWAREDAWITHPHQITQDANVLFVLTISRIVEQGMSRDQAIAVLQNTGAEHGLAEAVVASVRRGIERPPDDYLASQGWVLIALQNAVYQLSNSPSLEAALVDTVGRGGDTDTNGAICGALLGAVYGSSGIPDRWIQPVLACEPDAGRAGVLRPRPREYWPVNALEIADALLRS